MKQNLMHMHTHTHTQCRTSVITAACTHSSMSWWNRISWTGSDLTTWIKWPTALNVWHNHTPYQHSKIISLPLFSLQLSQQNPWPQTRGQSKWLVPSSAYWMWVMLTLSDCVLHGSINPSLTAFRVFSVCGRWWRGCVGSWRMFLCTPPTSSRYSTRFSLDTGTHSETSTKVFLAYIIYYTYAIASGLFSNFTIIILYRCQRIP